MGNEPLCYKMNNLKRGNSTDKSHYQVQKFRQVDDLKIENLKKS